MICTNQETLYVCYKDQLVNYICQRNYLILCSCGFWHQVLLYFLPEESSSVSLWNIGIHPSECSRNWAGNMVWRFNCISHLHYDMKPNENYLTNFILCVFRRRLRYSRSGVLSWSTLFWQSMTSGMTLWTLILSKMKYLTV